MESEKEHPIFSNSVSEKPDHYMGQTCPVRTRTSDISGIFGLPEIRKPFVDTLVQVIQFLSQGVKRGRRLIRGLIFLEFSGLIAAADNRIIR